MLWTSIEARPLMEAVVYVTFTHSIKKKWCSDSQELKEDVTARKCRLRNDAALLQG